jgi:hypothetical protein
MLTQQKTFAVTLSAVVVAMTATFAAAQSYGPWSGRGMGPGMTPGFYGRAAIIDQNDDGRISDEEAASAAEQVFVFMDTDDDQALTREEYLTVRMGVGPVWNTERQTAMQARKEARFGEMDADKNGAVSQGEFLNAAKSHHGAADTDGDGLISPWEHRQRAWF